MSTEWKNSIIKGGRITPQELGLMGVSTLAVLAVPFMDGKNCVTCCYESRTATNGGILITRDQTPFEAALNTLFRQENTVIEVGFDDSRNLIESIYFNDGKLNINGISHPGTSKKDVIRQIASSKNISRIVSHQQDNRIVDLANELGLMYEEKPNIFYTHTSKSGFNNALRNYFGGVGSIGPLGIVFRTEEDILKEYSRLASQNIGAIIKFDYSGKGMIMSGTANPLTFEAGLTNKEIIERIRLFIHRENISEFTGEIQMLIPDHVIISVSSGTDRHGEIVAYESHVQTQSDGAADGALPLKKNIKTLNFFDNAWPHIVKLYKKLGMTGGHNINFLIMPPEIHKIAQSLYGYNIGDTVAIDCNYRPISGTSNAMARLQEETRNVINLANFRSRSIQLPEVIANNIHLLFHIASDCGLKPGVGGNFSVIKTSDLHKYGKHKAQVIVNGSDILDPSFAIDRLEKSLREQKRVSELQKKHGVYPREAMLDRNFYLNYLRAQLSGA